MNPRLAYALAMSLVVLSPSLGFYLGGLKFDRTLTADRVYVVFVGAVFLSVWLIAFVGAPPFTIVQSESVDHISQLEARVSELEHRTEHPKQ